MTRECWKGYRHQNTEREKQLKEGTVKTTYDAFQLAKKKKINVKETEMLFALIWLLDILYV